MNCKGRRRKLSWLNLRYYPLTFLRALAMTTKKLRIAYSRVKIWTLDFPNMMLGCFPLDSNVRNARAGYTEEKEERK